MEVHNKNISLVVGVSKKVPDIAVGMSFSFPNMSEKCLKMLMCNCAKSHELVHGSHEAALGYALFETIRDKLVSSPLEVSKSRVSNISCRSINNALSISWNCQATGSSLRKTCALAVSCLHPHKLFSKYTENIKFLSGKGGSKDEFAYCVKKMTEGIKKSIQLVAVGKINTDKSKLGDILDVIVKKVPAMENIGNGSEPVIKAPETKEEEYPIIKVHGIAAACVAEYIRSNSGGMGVDVVNKGVVIYNMSWHTKQKQLSEGRRIDDYVNKKYKKLGDEFSNVFAYFTLTQGYANADSIASILKSHQQPAKLASLIKENINK